MVWEQQSNETIRKATFLHQTSNEAIRKETFFYAKSISTGFPVLITRPPSEWRKTTKLNEIDVLDGGVINTAKPMG